MSAPPPVAASGSRDREPLYNSRITNTYLKLLRSRYPQVDIDDLLAYAGMELHQVQDEGHWFTQSQVNRFQERLRQLTGNPGIAREAGRFTASPDALGGISRYILGLVSPAHAYSLVGHFTNKFTRSSTVVPRQTGPTTVEIEITPQPGVCEQPFQCENRMGYMEAVSELFHYKTPRIEHPECQFRGGACCRYIVTWEPSPATRWRRGFHVALPLVTLGVLAEILLAPAWLPTGIFPLAGACLLLALALRAEQLKAREYASAVDTLERTSDDLLEQQRVNYESALMVNEIGQALNRTSDTDSIVGVVVDILKRRLDYDRGMVLLANPGKTRLEIRSGFGYTPAILDRLGGGGFNLLPKHSRGVFVTCFWERRPFLVDDADQIKPGLSQRSRGLVEHMRVKSFICCPIAFEDEPLGVLAVDNVNSKRPLLERDLNLLMGVAPQIAICLHNIRLNESRMRQFQSILQVLVATTEARDPITAGHSLKVTEYAVGICRQLGLSSDYTEMIRVAAALHDYGKIGIYDGILRKRGRLSPEEYETVKAHVVKTREILERVNFEGIYSEVPVIAGAHHEKVDGTGYPSGLAGGQIPFGARILAVADVFEALTSKRHYRDPMPLEAAFDELVVNTERHFEPACVEALIGYYNAQVAPTGYSFASARERLLRRGGRDLAASC